MASRVRGYNYTLGGMSCGCDRTDKVREDEVQGVVTSSWLIDVLGELVCCTEFFQSLAGSGRLRTVQPLGVVFWERASAHSLVLALTFFSFC